MQCDEVLAHIRGTLAAITVIDTALVVPDARWEDFGADRFDVFAVLKDIEKRYGIKVPNDDAFEMDRVGDLIAFIDARRK